MGHGFGLSQNTAEELAKEGYGYREILAYFYEGAVIGQAGNL
jgi:stage II sporulation protein D